MHNQYIPTREKIKFYTDNSGLKSSVAEPPATAQGFSILAVPAPAPGGKSDLKKFSEHFF